MAHTKAGGSRARQGGNVAGKRRGVKIFGGSVVKPGDIIVRQLGRKFAPGSNVGMGRDFTIYAKINGIVRFNWLNKSKQKVDVEPVSK
jgi:large subunit ribosomal protein L27